MTGLGMPSCETARFCPPAMVQNGFGGSLLPTVCQATVATGRGIAHRHDTLSGADRQIVILAVTVQASRE